MNLSLGGEDAPLIGDKEEEEEEEDDEGNEEQQQQVRGRSTWWTRDDGLGINKNLSYAIAPRTNDVSTSP